MTAIRESDSDGVCGRFYCCEVGWCGEEVAIGAAIGCGGKGACGLQCATVSFLLGRASMLLLNAFANIIYCITLSSIFEGPAGSDAVAASALSVSFGCGIDVPFTFVSAGSSEVEAATVCPTIMGARIARALVSISVAVVAIVVVVVVVTIVAVCVLEVAHLGCHCCDCCGEVGEGLRVCRVCFRNVCLVFEEGGLRVLNRSDVASYFFYQIGLVTCCSGGRLC